MVITVSPGIKLGWTPDHSDWASKISHPQDTSEQCFLQTLAWSEGAGFQTTFGPHLLPLWPKPAKGIKTFYAPINVMLHYSQIRLYSGASWGFDYLKCQLLS